MAGSEAKTGSGKTYSFGAGSYERQKSDEEELFELVRLSEVPMDRQLFKVILELLKLNVSPAAILQVLKSLRSQNTPDDLSSQSPLLQRADPSSASIQAPPTTSDPAPPDFLIHTASLPGAKSSSSSAATAAAAVAAAERPGSADLSDSSGGGQRVRSKQKISSVASTASSGKHHKSRHKKSSHHSKDRDPTRGSARLKIDKLTSQ